MIAGNLACGETSGGVAMANKNQIMEVRSSRRRLRAFDRFDELFVSRRKAIFGCALRDSSTAPFAGQNKPANAHFPKHNNPRISLLLPQWHSVSARMPPRHFRAAAPDRLANLQAAAAWLYSLRPAPAQLLSL